MIMIGDNVKYIYIVSAFKLNHMKKTVFKTVVKIKA